MSGKTVYFTFDPANPPQLTAEEQERLDSIRDEDIDLRAARPEIARQIEEENRILGLV